MMELESDNNILRIVADGGSMDYGAWPELLPRITKRLEEIARTEFPALKLPPIPRARPSTPPQVRSQPDPPFQDSQDSIANSESADKENAAPAGKLQSPHLPDVETSSGTLPPQILSLLTSITQTLESYFSHYPPHTIQRLSELVLTPRKHYRTLPTYLHAVDRVVHVTSGANIYPLPAAVPDAIGAKILSNGTSGSGADPESISWGTSTTQTNPGSDESLGGALLTPIPWLRSPTTMTLGSNHLKDVDGEVRTESTETIDGPNGAGSIETVSVSVNGISSATLLSNSATSTNGDVTGGLRAEGGVTQGELLRQEQRAGVVPATQLSNHNRPGLDGEDDEDDVPHARGPDEIGMEDMGPQAAPHNNGVHGMQGIDVEAAVGRRVEMPEELNKPEPDTEVDDTARTLVNPAKRDAEDELSGESKKAKEESPIADDVINAEVQAQIEESPEIMVDEGPAGEASKKEDEEMELVDADGRTEAQPKVGEKGENVGADAVDASVL